MVSGGARPTAASIYVDILEYGAPGSPVRGRLARASVSHTTRAPHAVVAARQALPPGCMW